MRRRNDRVSFLPLIINVLCLFVLGCSSSDKKTEQTATALTPTQKLHRAILSQDPQRVDAAIKLGANVNIPIKRADHLQPEVSMSADISTPLNAVISDYKYKNSDYVAPLPPNLSHTDISTTIVKMLIVAGANINTNHFFSQYEINTTFETGGKRLAFAIPLMMTVGFVPKIEDLLQAFQHYSVFSETAIKYEGFEDLLTEVYEEKLPKKLQKFIERFELESTKKQLQAYEKSLLKKESQQEYKAMLRFRDLHKLKEPIKTNQKLCIFKEYEVTVGFVKQILLGEIKFKPAYRYHYDHRGIDRASRSRIDSSVSWYKPNAFYACPPSS